ncbi:MAG TPA: CBS domain-containing protein [Bacillota bacterium]
MKVHEFMSPNPVTIEQDQNLREAYLLMQRHGIRHLPVIDIYDRILGIVSRNDLYRAIGLRESRDLASHVDRLERLWAQDVMISPAYSVNAGDDLTVAIDVMLTNKVGALPVVDDDRRVVGIISEIDMLSLLRDLLQAGARPAPRNGPAGSL